MDSAKHERPIAPSLANERLKSAISRRPALFAVDPPFAGPPVLVDHGGTVLTVALAVRPPLGPAVEAHHGGTVLTVALAVDPPLHVPAQYRGAVQSVALAVLPPLARGAFD